MKNIVALSPVFTEDSINLKHASIGSDYNLNRFNLKWNVPEEFRNDVIAVYGEDIYAEIVSCQCDLTLLKLKIIGCQIFQKNLPNVLFNTVN